MTTVFQNRLFTPELEKALKDYPLYSQDGKKKDAMCIAVFHIGNIRWYVLEGQKEGNDFILYGVVFGLIDNEYGYVSLNEMADLTIDASKYGLGVLKVEQVEEFKACRLTEIGDADLQAFLSRMYDKK